MNPDELASYGDARTFTQEPLVQVAASMVAAVLLVSCGTNPTGASSTSTTMEATTTSISSEVTPPENTSPPPTSTADESSHQITPDDVTLIVPKTLTDIERIGWDSTHGAPYSSVVYFRGEAQYALHVTDTETGFPIGEYVLGRKTPSPAEVVSSAVGDLTVFTAEQLDWPEGGVVVATGICGSLELWQESRSSLDMAVSDLTEIIENLDCR